MESIINKKIKNATVITFNNIKFKSKLECLMYKLLIESNLEVQHEETKIILMEGFYPKKWFSKSKEQVKKILNLTYTPDFIIKHNDYTVYIEVKGFMSDNYPIKRKLFLNKINDEKNSIFFEVYTKKDMLHCIEYIKSL